MKDGFFVALSQIVSARMSREFQTLQRRCRYEIGQLSERGVRTSGMALVSLRQLGIDYVDNHGAILLDSIIESAKSAQLRYYAGLQTDLDKFREDKMRSAALAAASCVNQYIPPDLRGDGTAVESPIKDAARRVETQLKGQVSLFVQGLRADKSKSNTAFFKWVIGGVAVTTGNLFISWDTVWPRVLRLIDYFTALFA